MVLKRQCSFCSGEIEPGTGLMFVKRDGTIFHFCSGSCRKQQLHLGRVGHRVRWTRAHALKREQATAQASGGAPRPAVKPAKSPAAGRSPVPKASAPAVAVAAAGAAETADAEPTASGPTPDKPADKKPRARREKASAPKSPKPGD
ncbi:MAG TPA: 50S ribosomal protein L24e [Thermoplasmata archaeon]|nr:50S ribosomal protein L24e [Thermoplasmata archaeon]